MCRWIAFVSEHPILLEDLLINAPHPITQQVHTHYHPKDTPSDDPDFLIRNVPYNLEGFGVTWYTGTRSEFDASVSGLYPTTYKTTAIPTTDATFNSVCGNTASKCIAAHVRAATRPPVAPTNNHPFIFGRHSFMHNGGITNFHEIRLEMLKETSPKYGSMIHGNTDSEHLAALISVLRKLVANSLNLCTTDGESLLALRYRSPNLTDKEENPPSLYVSYTAAGSLNRKYKTTEWNAKQRTVSAEYIVENAKYASTVYAEEGRNNSNPHGDHVIVASEPANFKDGQWTLLRNREFIMVHKGKNTMPVDDTTEDSMEVTFENLNLDLSFGL